MTSRDSTAADELRQRITAAATAPGTTVGAWPGVEFLRADAPLRRTAAAYEPAVCIVAQGHKVAWLGDGARVDYDPLHYLVVGVPMPIDAEITRASRDQPFLAVRVRLDPALLTDVLVATCGDGHDAGAEHLLPALATSPLDASLLDVVIRLLRACEDPLEQRVLLEPLQRELLFRLATGPQGAMLRQIVFRDHQGHRVVRVIRHVERHFARPLSVADLARVARMGESTFHRAFRAVTGTTPLRYLKRLRLHRARALMLNEDLTAAEAGARVGYPSPSQFSREFKTLFGDTPRRVVSSWRSRPVTSSA